MNDFEPALDQFFDSMEGLADAISESLMAQVTIEDSNHHVIGYSSHQFESDPARISTIIGKVVPSAVIIGLRKKGVMQRLETSGQPQRIPAVMEVGLGPRLAVCIKHQQEILGYIWVVDRGNLPEGHAERIVAKAAGIAARYLLKQRGWKLKQEKAQEDFFWKLLTSHFDTEPRIRLEAQAESIALPEHYYIGVIEYGQAADEPLLQRLRSRAESISGFLPLFLTAEQNRVIALFSFRYPVREAQQLQQAIGQLQRESGRPDAAGVNAACSREYREYASAEAAYREALAILGLKKLLPYHTRELLLYETVGFWAYVPAILEQKRRQSRRSSLLMPLIEHDREHKSDFLKTVAVYLSLDGNLKEAAAYLHIHTNTLMYRLSRIAELTGRSLKETHYRLSVYLDLLTEETEQLNEWFRGGGE